MRDKIKQSNKAFTLIEVMVVLSILAIIAILGYNFFGSTMKEARLSQVATLIEKNLNIMGQCVEEYVNDNGTLPPDLDNAVSAFANNCDIKGDLTVIPDAFYTGLNAQRTSKTDFNGDGKLDIYGQFAFVTEDLCNEYNRRYAPHLYGGAIPGWAGVTANMASFSGFCFDTGAGYAIDKLLFFGF